jgi:hypothetical protein
MSIIIPQKLMIDGLHENKICDPGLCAKCGFMRTVESDRGTIFYRCLNATMPKYPRIPVVGCDGFKPKAQPT